MIVYVLTYKIDGHLAVQGVYSTKKKAEKERESVEDSCAYKQRHRGEYQFDWRIHKQKIDEGD
jgi:hypothetical protein